MLFNSYVFIFAFLPLTLLGYHLALRFASPTAAFSWVAAASVVFYAWGEPRFVLVILGSMAVNWSNAQALQWACTHRPRWATPLVAAGVVFHLAVLGYFKYAGFFIATTNAVGGLQLPVPEIVLPLGISFFTFQKIALLVDIRCGRTRIASPSRYALFVLFFPQLIAGPIIHHKPFVDQLDGADLRGRALRYAAPALMLFVVGLFKKVVIADAVAQYANPVFAGAANGLPLTFFEAWLGALAYTLQIYFDFSAYSDMACGLAALFGIRLPINFFSPYKATSIIEFWRRWHITLSHFLRDYIYIPLGGGRDGAWRGAANLLTVMLLGGLWHGAGWTFVLWGGLHGLLLAVNHAWRRRFGPAEGVAGRLVCQGATFAAVTLAWVLFRATSLDGAAVMFSAMLDVSAAPVPRALAESLPALGLSAGSAFANKLIDPVRGGGLIVALMALCFLVPNIHELTSRYPVADRTAAKAISCVPPRWLRWRPDMRWGAAFVAAALIAVLSVSGKHEFIYFHF